MKISIAQTRPIKGDIAANIEKHLILAEIAASYKANAIFFPELSLTGYWSNLANELASNQDDTRLDVLQKLSDQKNITIGAGLPTRTNTGLRISMIIIQPNKNRLTYSKQLLFIDEVPFFEKGESQIILTIGNQKLAPAICYESLQSVHSATASNMGAEIYMASVAKTTQGVEKSMSQYAEIAKKYAMPVFMSNCLGECDNFVGCGRSAVWNKQGQLVGQLDDETEGLIIFDTETEEVIKHSL